MDPPGYWIDHANLMVLRHSDPAQGPELLLMKFITHICVMNRIVNALFFLSLTQISPPDLPGPCRMTIISDTSMPTAFKQYLSETRKCVRCVILALLCICRNNEIAECSGRAVNGHNRGVAIIGDCM